MIRRRQLISFKRAGDLWLGIFRRRAQVLVLPEWGQPQTMPTRSRQIEEMCACKGIFQLTFLVTFQSYLRTRRNDGKLIVKVPEHES